MSKQTFRIDHTIRSYECDTTGEAALPALISILVEVSGIQTDQTGTVTEDMAKRDLHWVIVQYEINNKQMPKNKQTVILQTEAYSFNRFFTYRGFQVLSQTEETLVEFGVENDNHFVRYPPIQSLDEQLDVHRQEFNVRYYDIDSNRHVNNSKYFDWMLNALPASFLSTHELQHVNIKYEHEVEYGNRVVSLYTSASLADGKTRTAHRVENKGVLACKADFLWQSREA